MDTRFAKNSRGIASCSGPRSRRSFLQWGALTGGLLGSAPLSLPELWQAQALAGDALTSRDDTSVIFVWLPGGPPHMEMYDLKPNAPLEYRGILKPIRTNVPGIEISEWLPRHAEIADQFTLVRSIAHEFSDHGGGHKRFLTGRLPASPVGFVNDAPAVTSIVSKMKEHLDRGVPNTAMLAPGGRDHIDVFSFGSAYLGQETYPFIVSGDPSAADFEVRNLELAQGMAERLEDRTALLQGFDSLRRRIDAKLDGRSVDLFQERALDLLTSSRVRQAFDLSQEDEALRDRYGRHAWGQRALMARRLIEAGVTFVTVVMENPYQSGVPWLKNGTYNWDSHAVNCHIFDDLKVRLPIYDQAVTALIQDMNSRGLTEKTLVIVTGEFGRTPRITEQIGSQTQVPQPGRDHWPDAMSLLCFGGGMRTGQVVGSTNSKGEHPQDRPLSPNDLWATVYRHLGIDPEHAFLDHQGRPMPILPFGSPIAELT